MAIGDKLITLDGLKAVYDKIDGDVGELQSALTGTVTAYNGSTISDNTFIYKRGNTTTLNLELTLPTITEAGWVAIAEIDLVPNNSMITYCLVGSINNSPIMLDLQVRADGKIRVYGTTAASEKKLRAFVTY